MNKLIITIILALGIAVTIPSAFAVTTTDTLFGCAGGGTGDEIHLLNKTDGTTISNQTIIIAGLTVTGCNGLAVDPTTGIFYAIIKDQANPNNRNLVTIDPFTGIGTNLGGTGDSMATLGFLANGSARTVTGFNSVSAEDFTALDKTNAQATALCSFIGSGTSGNQQGQGLALNFDDNKIYHHTGAGTAKLVTVDNETVQPCGITINSANLPFGGEIFSFTYNTNDAIFYGYGTGSYFNMTTSGVATLITSGLPVPFTNMKGIAFTLVLAGDTTPPVITTTVSEPIPVPRTELPFTLILNNVTGGGSTVTRTDNTANNNEMHFQFIDVSIPSGAKVHAITLKNTGSPSETVMGWYNDAINLSQDLGIEITQSNDFANPEEIQWTFDPPVVKVAGDTPRFGWISNQTTGWLAIAGADIKFDSNESFPTLPNTVTDNGIVSLNLFQIITFENVADFNPFDEFEFLSCIDDTDGDITNTMTTVGTVDTSKPKSYIVTYTCSDSASNQSQLQVQYVVKRSGTSSGGTAPSAPSLAPTPAPTEVDRAFDLFATLNQLFAPTEPEPIPTEPTPTIPTAPTPPSLEQVRQQNLIEAIQSFFARLFG